MVPTDLKDVRQGEEIELDSSSVIVITGGARGITAQIAEQLAASYRPTLVILGRSARPEATEDPATARFFSQREIKAAIMEQLKGASAICQRRRCRDSLSTDHS